MHVDFVAHVRLRTPAAGGDFGGNGRGTALQRAVAVGSGFRGTRGRSFPDSLGQGRVLAGGFAVVHVHLNELEGFGSVAFHRFIVGLQHGLLNDILRAGRGWVGDLAAAKLKRDVRGERGLPWSKSTCRSVEWVCLEFLFCVHSCAAGQNSLMPNLPAKYSKDGGQEINSYQVIKKLTTFSISEYI